MTDREKAEAILKIVGIDFPVAGFKILYDVNVYPLTVSVRYYPCRTEMASGEKPDA